MAGQQAIRGPGQLKAKYPAWEGHFRRGPQYARRLRFRETKGTLAMWQKRSSQTVDQVLVQISGFDLWIWQSGLSFGRLMHAEPEEHTLLLVASKQTSKVP